MLFHSRDETNSGGSDFIDSKDTLNEAVLGKPESKEIQRPLTNADGEKTKYDLTELENDDTTSQFAPEDNNTEVRNNEKQIETNKIDTVDGLCLVEEINPMEKQISKDLNHDIGEANILGDSQTPSKLKEDSNKARDLTNMENDYISNKIFLH